MPIRIVQLGSPRARDEGPRLGTVRRPPRGVKKTDYGQRDFYDVWLPELAPSQRLFTWVRNGPATPVKWQQFEKRYRREMAAPAAVHLIHTLAALSHGSNFSIGCYCENESACHRGVLRRLLQSAGAALRE
jgi:uncharacterized protein YeaO (DUF488 family)